MSPQDIRAALAKLDSGDVKGCRLILSNALSNAPRPEDATDESKPIPSAQAMKDEGINEQAAREIERTARTNPARARQALYGARARLAGGVSPRSPWMPGR